MTRWLVGLIPGALAALVAALVSLPLESPDDAILNSGTVTVGALATGLALGAAWVAFGPRPQLYLVAVIAAFGAVALTAVLFETRLDRSYEYVLPLGAIVVAICGALTPFVERLIANRTTQMAASGGGLVAALAVGLALAGQGDHEATRLAFPEARGTPVATSGATTVPGETPGGTGTVITTESVEGVEYAVVPGESTVQYTVREQLAGFATENDAQGSTTLQSGSVYLDGTPSTFTFDASTFSSDQDRRDNYIRQNIFAADPVVTFTVDELSGLPEQYTPGQDVQMQVTGTATVVGVSRPLTFDVTGRFDGDELQLLGSTDFTWADFEITPPNTQLVTVQNNVHIEVLIIARPT